MGISVGGHGKDPSRRRPRKPRTLRIEQTPAQKPFRPLENPFPEKGEFRLGTYRIIEEKDDYLICEGFDPRAKNPFSEITPSAPRTIEVAKPPLLLKTPWNGETVNLIVDGTSTPVAFAYTGIGKRTATATIGEDEVVEIQRITMDYIVGDSIVAIEVARNPWQDGIKVNDVQITNDDGANLTWIDLNVSGRCWAKTSEEVEEA